MSWRVAIASLDGVSICEHFGRAKYFYIIDVAADGTGTLAEKRCVTPLCQGGGHSDEGFRTSIDSLKDCVAVLVSKIGPSARRQLELERITVFEQADYIDEAVKKLAVYFARTKTKATGETN